MFAKKLRMGVCTRQPAPDSNSRGALEQLMDESLVRLGLFCGEAAKAREEWRRDSDGDELFGISRFGTADTACSLEFFAGRFRDIREINAAVRNMLCALCGLPGGR